MLKGIAPNTLSERLRTLEENGVVERRLIMIPAGRGCADRVCPHREGSRARPDRPRYGAIGAASTRVDSAMR